MIAELLFMAAVSQIQSTEPSLSEGVLLPAGLLGATGLLLGVGLAIAARRLAVQKDPLIEKLESLLPGANCGGCGFPGCGGFAEALAKENPSLRAVWPPIQRRSPPSHQQWASRCRTRSAGSR